MLAVVLAVVASAWLITLSVFDIRHRRLPDRLTLPGAVAVLAGAALCGHGAGAVLGAVVLFAVYAVVHLVAPAAMGAGDAKLAIGVGALTGAFGPDVWVLAALGAPLLTAVPASVVMLRGGRTVPHGPAMCLSAAVAVAGAVL